MEKRTPLALFAYNRPDHVRRALESLSACRRLDECRLVVFCDGPRNPDESDRIMKTRETVRQWADANRAEVIERDTNLGLAQSIVSGVSDLCREHGRVIVVEDDLAVSPDFVDYMLQGLDRYEDDSNVYQISGHTIADFSDFSTDTFLLPLTTTWGWATWERAWKIFSFQVDGVKSHLKDNQWRTRFDLGGEGPFSTMLEAQLAGKSDSWGILWWYAVFNAGGLVLYPKCSLVWNGGFDCSGVHCGADSGFDQAPPDTVCRQRFFGDLTFPDKVEPDLEAFEKVKDIVNGGGRKEVPPKKAFGKGLRSRITKLFADRGSVK